MPETFLARFPVSGFRFPWLRPSANTENSRRTREKPLVPRVHQQLFSLVNMGLYAAIIRLSPLIHEGEQRYKPYIVGDPRMVSLLWLPLWKILATPLKYWDNWKNDMLLFPANNQERPYEQLLHYSFRLFSGLINNNNNNKYISTVDWKLLDTQSLIHTVVGHLTINTYSSWTPNHEYIQ